MHILKGISDGISFSDSIPEDAVGIPKYGMCYSSIQTVHVGIGE